MADDVLDKESSRRTWEGLGRALFQCVIQMRMNGESVSAFEFVYEHALVTGKIVDTKIPAEHGDFVGILYMIELNCLGRQVELELIASLDNKDGKFHYVFEGLEFDGLDYELQLPVKAYS